RWIATWTTSPVTASATVRFKNQTLRQIVHVSIGGNRARVRFTNAFGTEPLFIGSAHVALRDSGAAIVAGSDPELAFGGEPGGMGPTGAPLLSDPGDLHLPPPPALSL